MAILSVCATIGGNTPFSFSKMAAAGRHAVHRNNPAARYNIGLLALITRACRIWGANNR